jgi:hypothetical protein
MSIPNALSQCAQRYVGDLQSCADQILANARQCEARRAVNSYFNLVVAVAAAVLAVSPGARDLVGSSIASGLIGAAPYLLFFNTLFPITLHQLNPDHLKDYAVNLLNRKNHLLNALAAEDKARIKCEVEAASFALSDAHAKWSAIIKPEKPSH